MTVWRANDSEARSRRSSPEASRRRHVNLSDGCALVEVDLHLVDRLSRHKQERCRDAVRPDQYGAAGRCPDARPSRPTRTGREARVVGGERGRRGQSAQSNEALPADRRAALGKTFGKMKGQIV